MKGIENGDRFLHGYVHTYSVARAAEFCIQIGPRKPGMRMELVYDDEWRSKWRAGPVA